MIEDPKPEDPSAEDPGPDRLERSMDVQSEPEKGEARLTREIQIKIGQQLRAMYADVVDQGVPDRFVELLRQLDEEGSKKDNE
jgi:carbon monoxide dehydrogenase subunit G